MIQYVVSALTIGVIAGILALGLNVRWGWAGEFDLAYYAFVAIGAYMGAVLQLPHSQEVVPGSGWILGLSLPFPIGLLGGLLSSAIASALFGAIALFRLRGDHFAISTIAFSLILAAFLTQEKSLFNGFLGVYGLQQPFEAQLNLNPDTYQWFFFGLCIAILVIVYVLQSWLYGSPFGRTLRAIREDETAAAAFGRNVYAEKLKAYVIGGAIGGVGGVMFAQYLGTWNPGVWSTSETFILYTAIFVGGQANAWGVLLGTLIALVIIPQGTLFLPEIPGHRDLFPALRLVASGILLVAVLKFRPQGLLPEPRPRDSMRKVGPELPSAVVPTIDG